MRGLGLGLALLLLAAGAGSAAEWQTLFNGRDLSGWHQSGEERWRVDGGTILGETGKGNYGWLIADRTYSDFVLRLRFKLEGKGNSGVQFRSWLEGTKMHGYQADIEPVEADRTGSLYDEHDMQWLKRTSPDPERVLHLDGWNDYEISAIGDHIEVTLNGVKANDLHHGRTPSGVIALQVHPAAPDAPVKVRFKDIRVLDLAPPRVTHSVYFWLKDGLGAAERAAFLRDCREMLSGIACVRSLEVKTPAGPAGEPVDGSYSVLLLVGLGKEADLQTYDQDPRHQAFLRRHQSDWKAVKVYNAVSAP